MAATETHTTWKPEFEVELVAGTPPGGGQDRPARALIEVLNKYDLLGQPIKLKNIPGRGGGNAWDYLLEQRGNPHVLAINSPTIISNQLLGVSALEFTDLTPIANLYTEYPVFIVRTDSSIANTDSLLDRLRTNASGVQISLATAIGNTNHIALGQVTSHTGGNVRDLKINVFDSARYAIADVLEGNAELGVITAVSAVPEISSGSLRAIAMSAPDRLGSIFSETPTWIEKGVNCSVGMWRGIIAASALQKPEVAFWESTIASVTAKPEWANVLKEKYWANTFMSGVDEFSFLRQEKHMMSEALHSLGLLQKANA